MFLYTNQSGLSPYSYLSKIYDKKINGFSIYTRSISPETFKSSIYYTAFHVTNLYYSSSNRDFGLSTDF